MRALMATSGRPPPGWLDPPTRYRPRWRPAVAGAQEGRSPAVRGRAVDGPARAAVPVGQVGRREALGEEEPGAKVGAPCRQPLQDKVAIGRPVDPPPVRSVDEQEPVLVARWRLAGVGDRGDAGVDGRLVCERALSELTELGRPVVGEPDGVVLQAGRRPADTGQDHEAGQRAPRPRGAAERAGLRQEVAVEVLGVDVGDHDVGAVPLAGGRAHTADRASGQLDRADLGPGGDVHPAVDGDGDESVPQRTQAAGRVPDPFPGLDGRDAGQRGRRPAGGRAGVGGVAPGPLHEAGIGEGGPRRRVQRAQRIDRAAGPAASACASGAPGRRSWARPGTCAG